MKHSQWKRAMPLFLCLALLGGTGVCETLFQPAGQANGFLTHAAGRDAAVAAAGGEFRTVAANVLWAKVVDHYHHQFMAQGGDWSKNVALLPLLHTITTLDPHFIQAYVLMGGEILPRTGSVERGRQVLAEGIHNNPADWELQREMALLLGRDEHNFQAALPYARQGLANARAASYLSTEDRAFAVFVMTEMTHGLAVRLAKH